MIHRPYPRWWRGDDCPFHDADYRQRVALCRARSQVAFARHEATRSHEAGVCTTPGFEDVVPPLSDEDDRDTDVADDECVSSSPHVPLDDDAPFADVVCRASSQVWGMPDPRPHQVDATEKIMFDHRCGGKLLLVVRTGAGKTHVALLTATMVGGIALVLVPLLALTADILDGLRPSSGHHGSIEAHHVDDLSPVAMRDALIPRMNEVGRDSASVMFLLCSPQELAKNGLFRAALLRASRRGALRLVVIDEAHLHATHGRSFRACIRVLHTKFFSVVFATDGAIAHPLFWS